VFAQQIISSIKVESDLSSELTKKLNHFLKTYLILILTEGEREICI